MKSAKGVSPKLQVRLRPSLPVALKRNIGSYVERVCSEPECPNPFEKFLSLSGIETLCPDCRNRAICREIRQRRRERIERWRSMGAGMRLLFSTEPRLGV